MGTSNSNLILYFHLLNRYPFLS